MNFRNIVAGFRSLVEGCSNVLTDGHIYDPVIVVVIPVDVNYIEVL